MAEGKSALSGLRVVDFSWVAMVPLAVRYLADHGATVVKIESERRPDVARYMWPNAEGIEGTNRCAVFAQYNTNRYSIALNLKHPRALDIVRKLIAWSDVVLESFTPGTMERMGLGYEQLKEIRPDIIMVRGSIQGQTGPHASQPGFGIQATSLSGFTQIVGWPDRVPVGQNFAYTDFIAPWYIIVAIMAALDYRRRTGKGQMIDISQFEAALSFLSPALLDYTVNKRVQGAAGNRCVYAAPHGVYRCKGDDKWCAIAVFSDEEWKAFCKVIGEPEWTSKFATLVDRKRNEDELDRLVERWTVNYFSEQVMEIMQSAGVAAGVVQSNRDLLEEDRQLKYRDYFWHLNHPEMGKIICDGVSFKLSKIPAELRQPAPCLGEHTEFICREILKIPEEELVELMQDGEIFV